MDFFYAAILHYFDKAVSLLWQKAKTMRSTRLNNLIKRIKYYFSGDPSPLKIEHKEGFFANPGTLEVFDVSFDAYSRDEFFNTLSCNFPLAPIKFERSWQELYGIKEPVKPKKPTNTGLPITIKPPYDKGTHFLVAVDVPKGEKVVKFRLTGTHFIPTKRADFTLDSSS